MKKNLDLFKSLIKSAPEKSGVYQMLDEFNNVLYVGKAKNLNKRLHQYTNIEKLVYKNRLMILKTNKVETFITASEADALIMEGNLIKKFRPPYNILLIDDKMYPYISFSFSDFPKIMKYRGIVKKGDNYFGPFASVAGVNEIILILQNVFGIRTCSDNFFKNRCRPCLLYQIKKCSAPCCGLISKEDYNNNLKLAFDFLKGKTENIKQDLINKMNDESKNENFEKAATLRDKINFINEIVLKNTISAFNEENTHVFYFYNCENNVIILVNFFENGKLIGFDSYIPTQIEDMNDGEILEQFLIQFYQNKNTPTAIYLNQEMDNKNLFEEAKNVKIIIPYKGKKFEFINNLKDNAVKILSEKIVNNKEIESKVKLIENDFNINKIKRIDAFDNSHLSKTNPVGGMIVFKNNKLSKNDYRFYNLSDNTNGDDLKMMRESLIKRYKNKIDLPDLILIDGGKTQLNVAIDVLKLLSLDDIVIASIAKGENRNSRDETVYLNNGEIIKYEKGSLQLLFLELLRDEVHNFIINKNRIKRSKQTFSSQLDLIEGVGAKKRKALMDYFGSLQSIRESSVLELMKVNGISKKIAENIKENL